MANFICGALANRCSVLAHVFGSVCACWRLLRHLRPCVCQLLRLLSPPLTVFIYAKLLSASTGSVDCALAPQSAGAWQ